MYVKYTDKDESKKQFKYPYQLANGPKNELIVADRECHQLMIFDENLKSSFVFGEHGSGEGKFHNPTGLAVDVANSYLYVSDHNNIIQKFKIEYHDDEGTFPCQFRYVKQYGGKGRKLGQLQCPCGLALSKSGSKLYVCDFQNHRIQVFVENGEPYDFGKHGKGHREFDEPHSIAINSNEDKIFVSDHSNNRIQVFTPGGDFCKVIIDYTTSPYQQMQYP